MSSAQVNRVSQLLEFRNALIAFQHGGKSAMDSISNEIQRTEGWLADKAQFWRSEIRRLEEKVTNAKGELARRKWGAGERTIDTTEQEKQLRRAMMELENAEEKLKKVKEWQRRFPDAVDEFETQGRPMRDALDYDVSKMVALMERLMQNLEAYMGVSAPPSGEKR